VARDNPEITGVTFVGEDVVAQRRIRRVDWDKIMKILDSNPGEWAAIGEFDQSVRTHIRNGRYSYIDPSKYQASTRKIPGKPRTRATLLMRRVASS